MAEYEDRRSPARSTGRPRRAKAGRRCRSCSASSAARRRARLRQRPRARRARRRQDPEPRARGRARPRLGDVPLAHRLQGSRVQVRRRLRRHAAAHQRLRADQTGDYFEQEFRLVSQTEGRLSWYAGRVLLPREHRRPVHPGRGRRGDVRLLPQLLRLRAAPTTLPTTATCSPRTRRAGRAQPGQGQVPGLGGLRRSDLRVHRCLDASLGLRYTTTRSSSNCRRSTSTATSGRSSPSASPPKAS
jgi:hypothetical protein